jgi:hypothetical protein
MSHHTTRAPRVRRVRLITASTLLFLGAMALASSRAEAGGIPPTDPNRPGGLPAQGSCGPDGLGTYVKFTVPGIDGTIVAQPTASAPAAATVVQNSADKEFTILSATFNGSPAVIAEVIGGVTNLNPIWSFSPPILAPTPVMDVTDSGNFSQFALCLLNAGPLTLNKTVNAGSGTFEFSVTCRGTSDVPFLLTTVSLTASPGSPGSTVVFPNVPVGAACTATETQATPADYTNDGPKTVQITSPAGASITINNFKNATPVDDVSIVKTLEPTVLGPTATSATFVLTVTNNGNRAATNVVVTDVVPALLTVTGVTGPGTWLAPTWTVGDILAGSTATLRITVSVPLTVGVQYPVAPPVENCATVVSTQDNASGGNNVSCVTVRRSR